jgi:tRNA(fMet)-specific endonuclease VapC
MISEWQILAFDHDALLNFERLKSARLKMSTLDMKIAAIALAYDATLLSRNVRDFRQVPGLKVESWLGD